MFYLLWSLLNIGLFLFFIVICIKATRIIREKMGLLASTVFVFGLLSFAGKSNSSNNNIEPNTNKMKSWKLVSNDTLYKNEGIATHTILEKNFAYRNVLDISFGSDPQTQLNIPLHASNFTVGLTSGINWKTEKINVRKTLNNNKFEYYVMGLIDWQLLGATIYTQPKAFIGTLIIK